MSKDNSRAISGCKEMLGKSFHNHHFFTANEAKVEMQKRRDLWKELEKSCSFIANNNKIHYGQLSPGCQACTKGKWTCLFVGGKCPNNCFFCPLPQNEERPPNAEGIEFYNVQEFISYHKKAQITGVSFSGGESMLYLDIVKEYCTAVRKEFSSEMYIWCYTSGLGVTKDSLKVLRQAGVEELRFNIAAFDYDLSKLVLAKKYIPKVTVEIPAIPEDLPKLKKLVKELELIGVDYLNLHELHLSEFNEKEIAKRGYKLNRLETGCTIHDSEMTILKLMEFAANNNIKLPINSCKFIYKSKIPCNAKNMRAAKLLGLESWEELTETGLIRSIWMSIANKDFHLIDKMNISKDAFFDREQQLLFAKAKTILNILDSNPILTPKLSIGYDAALIVRSEHNEKEFLADRAEFTDEIKLTVKDLRRIVEKKCTDFENSDLLELEVTPNGFDDLII